MIDQQTIERWNVMQQHVPDFWYLEQHLFFTNNTDLQDKLWEVVQRGLGFLVQVFCKNVEANIDMVLRYSDEIQKTN